MKANSPEQEMVGESEAGGRPAVSRRRRWAFRLIALGVPLVPLLIGEAICRCNGYGGYPPVLRVLGTHQGRTYVGSNQPGLSTFFFQNLTTPGSMEEQVFTVPKEPDTVRIFMLGGSAARGYPHLRMLAASSFLETMLGDLWPERQVEVLNLGTTAIASFPVMYILDEVLRLDPDLVILYSGNNEFYGAHGVASVHSFGSSTTAMRVFRFARRFALVQWLTDVATRPEGKPGSGEDTRPLMERVIADQQLGPDDRRRTAAADNLENHLTRMAHACRNARVPVVVCTLPANERDLAPIGEDVSAPLPEQERARFENLLEQGRATLNADAEMALAAFDSARSLDEHSAALHFWRGRSLTALDRHAEASEEYTQAKDLDTMPWRAPNSLNEAVRRAAKDGALLCDLEAAFRQASPGGAIGWELMDDHVHPSLRGQALIAETLLRTMSKLAEPLHVDPAEAAKLSTWQTYVRRLGNSRFDRYGTAHRMVSLLRAPFYRRNNTAALERFEAICAKYEAQMSPAELDAVRRWQNPHAHRGGHFPISAMVGEAAMAEGEYAEAERLLVIAQRAVPPYSIWRLRFSWKVLCCRGRLISYRTNADLDLAREMIDLGETYMAVTGVAPAAVHRYVGLAANLLGRHEAAIAHLSVAARQVTAPEGFEVIRALADSLVSTDQLDRARRLLQSPVRHPDLRRQCRRFLAEIDAAAEARP
ncbi:MAG: hypothetical protein GY842_06440 [bacterium]|nr:hypothetical protein [bacterium]